VLRVGPHRWLLVVTTLAALAVGPAHAESWTIHGLTFSDEMGGFTINGVSGSGSLADPITVLEEITSTTGVVLVIRGLGPHSGNPIPTAHPAGFAIRKIAIDATSRAWTFYDIELQKVFGTPSDLYDGLSFGQMSQAGRPFVSDGFAQSAVFEEPRDALSFFDGVIEPGQAVAMTFVITATGQVPEFFLLQRPNRPIAMLPNAGQGG
jgi:hypothetical protein